MNPCLVPTAHAVAFWPMVEPLLAPAFAHGGDYGPEDAPERLASGVWGLWVTAAPGAVLAAVLTEIVDFPQRRKLWVVAAGGDRHAIAATWPLISRVAADEGCSAVAWQGRKGWGRSGVLPDGFRHVADVMEIAL